MKVKNIFLLIALSANLNLFSAVYQATESEIEFQKLKNNFYQAILDNKLIVAEKVLEKNPELANTKYSNDYPLHKAVKSSKNMVALLLKYKADPNAQNSYFNTPLHELLSYWNAPNVYSEEKEITKILLANGANPSIKNNIEQTVFVIAKSDNTIEFINAELAKIQRRLERIKLAQEELPKHLPNVVANIVTEYLKK